MALPRADCAVGYAGYTGNAYPLMLQLSNALDAYAPAREGVLDISTLLAHIRKVLYNSRMPPTPAANRPARSD